MGCFLPFPMPCKKGPISMHNPVFRKVNHVPWWLLAVCVILLAACTSGEEAASETATTADTELATQLDLGEPVDAISIDMPEDPAARDGMFDAPPAMVIDPSRIYYAVMATDPGEIVVQLFADRTPKTVNNFVYLALTGYYDGTTFHRVINQFMAQGGDPTGTGRGGPGYRFEDEFIANLNFDRPGLLAMANSGPNTNGSQFFLTFVSTPHLDQKHTILGEVIEGMEALNAIALRDPSSASGPGDLLHRVSIYVNDQGHLPEPEPTPVPTPTPTPYAPHQLAPTGEGRPLADMAPADRIGMFNTPPDMVIEPNKTYTATISTDQGDLVFELLPEAAPLGVNNFVVLANLGFFDGLTFVRDGNDRVSFFGLLDSTADGLIGYSLVAENGYQGENTGPGLLVYVPDWNDPDKVLGGVLYITRIVWEPDVLARVNVIGIQTAGQELLSLLHGDEHAIIDSITVAIAE